MSTTSTIKKNYAWNVILTIAGYVFPFLTFPYVSRVLGAEGVGNYQFADSVIRYFSVFAMLGIRTVGIREVAKVKNNKEALSQTFSSILVLNLFTTIAAIFVLVSLVNVIPSFLSHKRMLYVGVSRLLFEALLIEWFFTGIEIFRYITIRSIIVRSVYVLSVFMFVRKPDDYLVYFVLTALTTVVNAIINCVYSHHFVSFSFRSISIKPYVKPFITLGFYHIMTSMYMSLNVILLGNSCGDVEVGYYSTATKLYGIIMSFFTAFTGVMMPRMSSLLSEGKTSEFKSMTNKSIDFLVLFCIPLIIISEVYAPQIIRLLSGSGFEGSIVPMRIVMPLMLIIGYEQILIIQMLTPMRKDTIILINSCFGAGIALILNLTIVPKLASIGSSIVWVCSEIAVLTSAQYFVIKFCGYTFPFMKIAKKLLWYFPAFAICMVMNYFIKNWFISFLSGVFFTGLYFLIIEFFILKNAFLLASINQIKNRLCPQKSH